MKLKEKMKAAIVACMLSATAYGQADIHFSQFYETSMLRNPSLTGVFSNDYKVGAYYRTQWASVSFPYTTVCGYAETRFHAGRYTDDYFSFGLLGYQDKAGSIDQKIFCTYASVNYSKSLNQQRNAYLSGGFTGGYNQYSFDRSKITTDNQFLFGLFGANNPTGENFNNTKMTMWDLGAGLNFNSSAGVTNNVTYMVGLAAYHLTQPKFTYLNAPALTQNMRFNFNAAAAFDLEEDFSTQVQVNYTQQGTFSEKIFGGLLSYNKTKGDIQEYALSAGLFFRLGDAVIPVVKMKYHNTSVAASYDFNVSKLSRASNVRGGYEITLSLTGNYSNKSEVLKKTVCPKF